MSRRANIARFKNHLTILIENDKSADLCCPLHIDAAINELTLKIQSAAAASTTNGIHSAVSQLNNALFILEQRLWLGRRFHFGDTGCNRVIHKTKLS